MQRKLYDSPGTLVFLVPKTSPKFQWSRYPRGRQTEAEYVQIGDFRPTSRYISETVKTEIYRVGQKVGVLL